MALGPKEEVLREPVRSVKFPVVAGNIGRSVAAPGEPMEEVNLGLPSRNVEPPKSRFEFKDGSSRGNSISIPVFAAAWAKSLEAVHCGRQGAGCAGVESPELLLRG